MAAAKETHLEARTRYLNEIKNLLDSVRDLVYSRDTELVRKDIQRRLADIAWRVASIELLDGREAADKVANRVRRFLSVFAVTGFEEKLARQRADLAALRKARK